MATSNEMYFDAAVRHQIGVQRFSSGEAKRVLSLLEKADKEIAQKLKKRLIHFEGKKDFTSKRFIALLKDIREARKEVWKKFRGELTPDLHKFAKMEVGFEQRMMQSSIPFQFEFAAVSPGALRKIVTARPFQGKLLKDWYRGLEIADRERLNQAIRLGLAQGETIPQIVQRVIGTRENKFKDGVLSISRRNAEAIVRTSVSHVSNLAREEFWNANKDIISALRWVSVLDGRTTAICRARGGAMVAISGVLPKGAKRLKPSSARPPAHVNCRSIMVAIIEGVALLGNRPFIMDTRTAQRRGVDFRKMAREQNKSIQTVRAAWAKDNIGLVPASTAYNEWLKKQPAFFQDEVLGKAKGKLFRGGGLQLDEFVNRRGNELTLTELARTQPEAFVRAGLEVA